jgi:single-strand DNA-binding protein
MLIGRLTRDPELRATGSGISVCTFTIAVDRRFQNRDAQTREADFIPVVVWRAQAENCAKYLQKGSQAAICGSIQTRTYDAPDGSKRYVTEVVADEVQFLSRPNGNDNTDDAARTASLGNPPFGDNMQTVEDEDVPF